jgi:hypothetical protein
MDFMKTFSGLVICSTLAACSPSSGGGGESPSGGQPSDGKSSVTYSGVHFRTTGYGSDPNTAVYCARGKSGYLISLMEKGENRKNSGWALDGVYFSFYRSLRPQDAKEVGRNVDSDVHVVLKEYKDAEGTFWPDAKACQFDATLNGTKLDIKFDCEDLSGPKGARLRARGWVECTLRQSDF